MAEKSNQHFVPQFYFRSFSNNQKSISLLNIKSGDMIENASIKGQASKKNFYGLIEVEDSLSKVESEFSIIFNKIKSHKSIHVLTRKEYQVLLANVALQKSRTMTARRKSKKMQDNIYQLQMEAAINNHDKFTDEEKEEYRGLVKDIEANPKHYQLLEMSIAIETATALIDMHPLLLINNTNRPFIFGDSPVVYTNPQLAKIKSKGVLGTKTPGLIIYFPLDSKIGILIIDHIAYNLKGGIKDTFPIKDLKDISALNRLQLHNASNAIYFSDHKLSDYVQSLWSQEKHRLKDHNRGQIKFGPIEETNNGDGSTSQLLHYYEPQLPFIPKLSFLKYKEISEDDYQFNSR